MAFVIRGEYEDRVCFYIKDKFGETHIIEKFIERGNVDILRYYIKQIYHLPNEHSKESIQNLEKLLKML